VRNTRTAFTRQAFNMATRQKSTTAGGSRGSYTSGVGKPPGTAGGDAKHSGGLCGGEPKRLHNVATPFQQELTAVTYNTLPVTNP
jgi:hypothetical protein